MVKCLMNGDLIWDDFIINHKIKESAIEYIDPSEQDSSLIAMNSDYLTDKSKKLSKYTHVEIHPSTILVYLLVVFLSQSIINLPGTHISVLWENRQWECIQRIFKIEWIKQHMFKHIQ